MISTAARRTARKSKTTPRTNQSNVVTFAPLIVYLEQLGVDKSMGNNWHELSTFGSVVMVKLSRLDGFLDNSRRERHFFSCFSPLIKLINGFSSSISVSVVILICKQILTCNCSKHWCAENKTGYKNNHVIDRAKSRARQHHQKIWEGKVYIFSLVCCLHTMVVIKKRCIPPYSHLPSLCADTFFVSIFSAISFVCTVCKTLSLVCSVRLNCSKKHCSTCDVAVSLTTCAGRRFFPQYSFVCAAVWPVNWLRGLSSEVPRHLPNHLLYLVQATALEPVWKH